MPITKASRDQIKLSLASIALDLNRVSMGLHRGSIAMSDRFAKEALSRKSELDGASLPNYIKKLLNNLDSAVKDPDAALMTSILLQNHAQTIN